MADEGGLKNNNLARVRENQRRSRARRKEYLQDLECKFRNCELQGVEASAEIQAAARRVLEENKKLRALLRERGMLDAEIDACASPGGDQTSPASPAARVLEDMLSSRKPCTGERPSELGQWNGQPRLSSTPSVSVCTPRSSSAPIAPRPPQLGVGTTEQVQRATASVSSQTLAIPSMPTAVPAYTELPISPAQTVPNLSPHFDEYHYLMPQSDIWIRPQEANYSTPDTGYTESNSSSCIYAAHIVRSMRSDVGPELEAELGCQLVGTDCAVDNMTVLDVIDRY